MTEPSDAVGRGRVRDLSRVVFWPALALWLVVKVWLAWDRAVDNDEFESLHQGWLLFSGAVQYADFNSNHPPLVFELLGLLNHLSDDPIVILRTGRLIAVALTGLSLFLLHNIARLVYGDRAARWTVALFAVNAMILQASTDVRTDMLMVPLWLAAIWILMGGGGLRSRGRLIAVGLLLGTAFWANQKVIFHSVPLGLFVLAGWRSGEWGWRDIGAFASALLAPAIVFLARAGANGSLDDLIAHNFSGAFSLVASDPYMLFRAATLVNLLASDPGFVILAAAAYLANLFAKQPRTTTQSFISLAGMWMLLTFFITPGPFTYYTYSMLPLTCIVIGGWLAKLNPVSGRAGLARVTTVAALGLYAAFPLARIAALRHQSNDRQFQIVRLGTQLTEPGEAVFDGTGMLVTRPDAYGFDWIWWWQVQEQYNAGALPPLVPTLRDNGCKLIIERPRLMSLPADDLATLRRYFVPLWGPLRVPGFDSGDRAAGGEALPFELWYDSVYEADPPGAVVDGRPLMEPRHLSAGWHEVIVPKTTKRVVIRDAGHRNRVTLPSEDGLR